MPQSPALLRVATAADLPVIGALLAEVAQLHATARPDVFAPVPAAGLDVAHLDRYFRDPDARIFLAEDAGDPDAQRRSEGSEPRVGSGTVIGMVQCAVRQAPDLEILVSRVHVHVEDLVVVPTARGRGVGRALMDRAEAWARELGISTVELLVYSFNTPARLLYEDLGYHSSACLLTKQLPPVPSAESVSPAEAPHAEQPHDE